MKNKKWISCLNSVTFNGKEYPVRDINVRTFGQRTIAGESLEEALINNKDRYVSEEAKAIDEQIFFFVEDKWLNCGDEQLAAHVEREVG